MNKKKGVIFFAAGFLISQSLVFAVASDWTGGQQAAPSTAASPWSEGWYAGAEGYAKAVEEYEKTDKPMLVYFTVAWCPYCRRLEKGVLSSPRVREFLKNMIKVNINPEASQKENGLAFQYGVWGFPSLYLHMPQTKKTLRLYSAETPDEFIEQFPETVK